MSPAFISLVLSGKRRLSQKHAVKISEVLRMNADERRDFLEAVHNTTTAKKSTRMALERVLRAGELATGDPYADRERIEADRFEAWSSWHHMAILDLVECEDFRADTTWIAGRLGLEPSVAAEAFERLQRLGQVALQHGRWHKQHINFVVPVTNARAAIRTFHEQMLDKAREALRSAEPGDFERRSINGMTFAINPQNLTRARELIARFNEQMSELMAANGPATDVYQLNVHLFPLTLARTTEASPPQPSPEIAES